MNSVRWLLQGKRRVGACRSESAGTAAESAAASPLKMLVVDDVPIQRAILGGMLQLLFHSVTVDEAGDGREALDILNRKSYDIILSDWLMPNMDGLELVAWLHSEYAAPPPFILISACDEQDEIAALFSSHAIDGYLVKPHDQAAMKEIIGTVLGASAPLQ